MDCRQSNVSHGDWTSTLRFHFPSVTWQQVFPTILVADYLLDFVKPLKTTSANEWAASSSGWSRAAVICWKQYQSAPILKSVTGEENNNNFLEYVWILLWHILYHLPKKDQEHASHHGDGTPQREQLPQQSRTAHENKKEPKVFFWSWNSSDSICRMCLNKPDPKGPKWSAANIPVQGSTGQTRGPSPGIPFLLFSTFLARSSLS